MALCSNADKCGGCFYQGVPYREQLEIKEKMVRDLLDPVVKGEYVFETIIPSPLEKGYRNKMEFSFGDCEKDGPLTLGLHQKRSFYNILNTDDCQLPNEDFDVILRKTRDFFEKLPVTYFHKRSHEGYLRHLLIRRAYHTGEILTSLVTTTQVPESVNEREMLSAYRDELLNLEKTGAVSGNFAGILHTKNDSPSDAVIDQGTEVLYGQDFFMEKLLGLQFRISPFSFFQTNTAGAEKLYTKVREYAGMSGIGVADGDISSPMVLEGMNDGNIAASRIDTARTNSASTELMKPVIYDLYSGTGTITQIMSDAASLAIGVEIVPEAVEAARENAKLNGIQNCRFIAGDVLKVIAEGGELAAEDGSILKAPAPDFIILDPPREGVHPKALQRILEYGVQNMIYVSCKPQSLARDLEPIQNYGYRVLRVCPVDMFPQTKNVETVCLLNSKKMSK